MRKGQPAKRGKMRQLVEYWAVRLLLGMTQTIPLSVIHSMGRGLGDLFFALVTKRREIAINNIRQALGNGKSEVEVRKIAQASCRSFFMTYLEISKFLDVVKAEDALESIRRSSEELTGLFEKAKAIHDQSGGCLFVTPHIGNWELLPHVSAMVGIPLVVVARPMDNALLERLIYRKRADTGQLIIPKRNALMILQKTLQQGKSIGMLPDQATKKGITVGFFDRQATTTPVPALLAVTYERPIVVVACCRKEGGSHFEGVVSDPIWPDEHRSEKEEIFRLTREMNRTMESVVRKYPEQYLWMHNRWKTYSDKRAVPL